MGVRPAALTENELARHLLARLQHMRMDSCLARLPARRNRLRALCAALRPKNRRVGRGHGPRRLDTGVPRARRHAASSQMDTLPVGATPK